MKSTEKIFLQTCTNKGFTTIHCQFIVIIYNYFEKKMDNFEHINDYAQLDAWIDIQEYKYNKLKENVCSLIEIICPNGILHESLKEKSTFCDLPKKFYETIRNCQIILRKIDIYDKMIEKNIISFNDTKRHCEEINSLNKIYVKKWNNITPTIKTAINNIKK